jgi:hypothetical protein
MKKAVSSGTKSSDILRKSFNSSEFFQNRKIRPFIALENRLWPDLPKKRPFL